MRRHLTDEEQTLITRMKEFVRHPAQNSGQGTSHSLAQGARPPLDLKTVNEAEEQLGFPLPPLLRELFLQVGNGGFGPSYGLFRLMGNYPKDDEAVVSTYQMSTGPDVPAEYDSWHPRHILILHGGCNIYSAVDCTTAKGAVYRYSLDRYREEEDGPLYEYGVLEADSLREWLEAWLSEEALGERGV